MEIIHENNGWTLHHSGTAFYILKKNQYFTLPPQQLYHFIHTTTTTTTPLKPRYFHLGEYKPTCADSAFFSALPLVYNNHTFFVNTNTQIVYIIPPPKHHSGISINVTQATSYNFNLCANYKFGGMYHPHTNATSHFAHKTFLQFISPLAPAATPIPPPIRNNNNNNITFIIPFIHTTNTDSLHHTITSLQTHVTEPFSIVILSPPNTTSLIPQYPNTKIVAHTNYVGHLGFENKLNVLMHNKYDRATFYNSLIATYGKLTPLCAIWEYNWLLEKWIPNRGMFKVPNYYQQQQNQTPVPSPQNTGKVGALLHGAIDTYNTTPDHHDTALKLPINHQILVKGIYTPHDARDWQNLSLYGNLIEMKQFFANPISTIFQEPQNTTISEEPQSSMIISTISEEPQSSMIISTISEEPQNITISEEHQSSMISEEHQSSMIISTISEEPQSSMIISTISEEPQNITISEEHQSSMISEEHQSSMISEEPQSSMISEEPQSSSIISTVFEEPQSSMISEEPQNTMISEEPQSSMIISTISEEPQNTMISEEPQNTMISEEHQNAV